MFSTNCLLGRSIHCRSPDGPAELDQRKVGTVGVARVRLSFALLLVFTLAVALPARADDIVQVDPLDPQPTAENGVETDESATSWFVELAAPSTSDGGTAATVATSHDAFKNAAQARGVNYAQRFEYGDLWNGFAVDASGADVSALRGLAGGKSLWPVATVSLPGPEAGDGGTIDLATAIQMTGADRMDGLDMGIGPAVQWPSYPTAVAADRLVMKHGMVVVASIGNNGPNGLYSAGAPGLGANVIGVASFDNISIRLPYFTASGDDAKIGYFAATAAAAAPTPGSFPLARTGTTASVADACTPLPSGSLAGRVVIIRRGTCGLFNKALNAQNAG